MIFFGLALGKNAEVRDLGSGEERGRSVGTGRDAGSAADAGGGVHSAVGVLFADGDGIAVGCATGRYGNVATGLDDAVESAAVDDQVLDEGEGSGAPRFEHELFAVFEVAHGELADGGGGHGSVCDAVDHEAAHAADAFAAIVIEGDGVFAFFDEGLVEDVEQFEHRHFAVLYLDGIADEFALGCWVLLAPDAQFHSHYL